MASLLLFAVAVYWMLPKTREIGSCGYFTEQAVAEQAKLVIQYVGEDDYESLRPLMAAAMQEAGAESAIRDAKKKLAEDGFGAVRSWGNMQMSEVTQQGQHAAVVEVEVSYENVSVTYRMSFNIAMQLNGIYMK